MNEVLVPIGGLYAVRPPQQQRSTLLILPHQDHRHRYFFHLLPCQCRDCHIRTSKPPTVPSRPVTRLRSHRSPGLRLRLITATASTPTRAISESRCRSCSVRKRWRWILVTRASDGTRMTQRAGTVVVSISGIVIRSSEAVHFFLSTCIGAIVSAGSSFDFVILGGSCACL